MILSCLFLFVAFPAAAGFVLAGWVYLFLTSGESVSALGQSSSGNGPKPAGQFSALASVCCPPPSSTKPANAI